MTDTSLPVAVPPDPFVDVAPPTVAIVTELDTLEALAPAWDALAVAAQRPRCAPAWTLAWYRHALPPGAAIRAITVTRGSALLGMCPLYLERTGFGLSRYALAAPMLHGVEPLWAPGCLPEVGPLLGAALAGADPTPDVIALDWGPAWSPVTAAFHDAWDRPRPSVNAGAPFPALRVVHHGGDFEQWLAGRSSKFRQGFRYDYRRLQTAGFEHRLSTTAPDILERLPAVRRLYEVRRRARDGAGEAFDDTFTAVVSDAVAHSGRGRVSLSTLERADEVVACGLVLSAGDESTIWLTGFDEAWAHLGPARVDMALCVAASIERGDAVFDMGSGGHPYKYRFTDDATLRQHVVLARRGLRPFHSPLQLVPYRTRRTITGAAGRIGGRLHGALAGPGRTAGPPGEDPT